MSARKTERLLNLVICLLATRRYLSAEQIRRTVAGYEELGDEAFKRKFERDKEDLRDLGIPLQTTSRATGSRATTTACPRSPSSRPSWPHSEWRPAPGSTPAWAARRPVRY
jgi:proteasome accessory factor B